VALDIWCWNIAYFKRLEAQDILLLLLLLLLPQERTCKARAMEIDLFLLLMVVAVIAASVTVNVKLLMYYQQESDSSFASSIFVKAIVVISLTLAWLVNLLLPIDVRNSRPTPGILDMQMIWGAAFITLAIFLVLIVPAAMFYHEVEDSDLVKHKRRHVCCNLTLLLFFSTCTVAISYPFLAEAGLPMVRYDCAESGWMDAGDVHSAATTICGGGMPYELTIKVSFDIYLIACLCFVGWFFFVTFGGIGLSAVPIDLILSFTDRPKAIDEHTYQQRRRLLGQATRTLLGRAEELQQRDTELAGEKGFRARRARSSLKAEYNKFKRDTLMLEDQHDRLIVGKFQKGENLAVSITKLVLGILFAILSLAWIFHVLLYIVFLDDKGVPATPFLNDLLAALEGSGVMPLGVASFALLTLYLLMCVVKGCLKFGMRIFLFFSIHPMRYKATPLNSILFNVEMVLVSSAAVVQFEQQAFADYARLTDADVIFAAQVKYLKFYRWFFENNVFIYTLLIWFLLALIYLLVRPRDVPVVKFDKKTDKQLQSLASLQAPAAEKDGKKGKKEKKEKKSKKSDKTPLTSA